MATDRLPRLTLELVALASESRNEAAILGRVAGRMDAVPGLRRVDEAADVLVYLPREPRDEADLVVLAGHVDTVPRGGASSPGRDGTAVVGRGAADMKGGLAVMLALAEDGPASDLDVGYVFFAREELAITESALGPLLDRSDELRSARLAVVLEPTANALQRGCMGNLNATVTVHGRAAHAARPWTGDNAIHRAVAILADLADQPVREVGVDGLTFRETASVTTIAGGTAANVIPDRVRAHVNIRYAPTTSPQAAEEWLHDLVGKDGAIVDIVANAPSGRVDVRNALGERLRSAGDLEVGAKQAWTPVAEFGVAGVDAVNFGPGDPRYAHADDERVDADALERAHDVLTRFLSGPRRGES